MKIISKHSKLYQKALNSFRKQFDVAEITKLFVNIDNQVYAGEWIDSNGNYNMNCNAAVDCKFTVIVR